MNSLSLPQTAPPDNPTGVSIKPKRRKDGQRLVTGRQTRTRTGQHMERTELLEREKAAAFQVALSNLPTIESATLCRDHHKRAAEPRFYVRFTRKAELPLSGPTQTMQDLRIERAIYQRPEMEFLPAVQEGWYYCLHYYPASDEIKLYLTHPSESCDCPDHTYRLAGSVVRCKHQNALRIEMEMPLVEKPAGRFPDTPAGHADRDAWIAAESAAGFPDF